MEHNRNMHHVFEENGIWPKKYGRDVNKVWGCWYECSNLRQTIYIITLKKNLIQRNGITHNI